MTLTELAKLAHVSVSTASKAFVMSDDINPETRDMVFKIAKEKGCFRTFFKAKYPKLLVGIVCYDIQNKFYTTLIDEFRSQLKRNNCETCILISNPNDKSALEAVNYFEDYTNADAIIFMGNLPDKERNHEIPIISFSGTECKNATISVNLNLKNAIYNVLNLAKQKNIFDVYYLGDTRASEKVNIFKECYKEIYDKPTNDIVVTVKERFEKGGYIGMQQLFSLHKPSLVLCGYDNMAFGALKYINEIGLNIPKDIQIIGIDNVLGCEYSIPRLSSICVDKHELTKIIIKNLRKIISGDSFDHFIDIEHNFYERESTNLNLII